MRNYTLPSKDSMVMQILAVAGRANKKQVLKLAQNDNNLSIVFGELLDIRARNIDFKVQEYLTKQLVNEYTT